MPLKKERVYKGEVNTWPYRKLNRYYDAFYNRFYIPSKDLDNTLREDITDFMLEHHGWVLLRISKESILIEEVRDARVFKKLFG